MLCLCLYYYHFIGENLICWFKTLSMHFVPCTNLLKLLVNLCKAGLCKTLSLDFCLTTFSLAMLLLAVAKQLSSMTLLSINVWIWRGLTQRRLWVLCHQMVNLSWWSTLTSFLTYLCFIYLCTIFLIGSNVCTPTPSSFPLKFSIL